MINKISKLEIRLNNLMTKGLELQKNGSFKDAISLFNQILSTNPRHYYARLNKGLTYILMNEPSLAAPILHKLHEEQPNKIDVLRLCGKSYWMLNQYDLAIKFLKRVINIDPDNYETWLDLTALFAANSQNSESLYFATHALSLKPNDARGHLNLGCALSAMGRLDEAYYCFETVLHIAPNEPSAYTNMAMVLEKRGDLDATLIQLDRALSLVTKGSEQEYNILYSKSYPLLAKGDLKNGWEMYANGFKPNTKLSRAPKRKFNVPLWHGQAIIGKKLLVWREQGLGDELMFSHILPETFSLCDNIIIECEPRLTSLFQRSFPECEVRAQEFDTLSGLPLNNDFDFQIPMGSLAQIFRPTIESFKRGKPYLLPNPDRVIEFNRRLKAYEKFKLVGICWRSGFLTADRSLHYAPLSSWGPIFDIENTVFINLQYGSSKNEIIQARELFNVNIIEWDDLDLRNDLEGVTALIANLDCVVSVGTAVAQLTGAVGKKLMLMTSRDWTLFGADYYPWFGNTQLFISDFNQSVEPLIPQVASSLRDL